mmetsp:Transcript_6758/g.12757  ORF Transcript_6758/g.12757 Transcript_6758/m.12757 type:complete len:209 (+) Transcript_6758:2085-2711(+)
MQCLSLVRLFNKKEKGLSLVQIPLCLLKKSLLLRKLLRLRFVQKLSLVQLFFLLLESNVSLVQLLSLHFEKSLLLGKSLLLLRKSSMSPAPLLPLRFEKSLLLVQLFLLLLGCSLHFCHLLRDRCGLPTLSSIQRLSLVQLLLLCFEKGFSLGKLLLLLFESDVLLVQILRVLENVVQHPLHCRISSLCLGKNLIHINEVCILAVLGH